MHVNRRAIYLNRYVLLSVLLLVLREISRESIVQHTSESVIIGIFVQESTVTLDQLLNLLLISLVLSNDLGSLHLVLLLLLLLHHLGLLLHSLLSTEQTTRLRGGCLLGLAKEAGSLGLWLTKE
jgi:hypothetical protein